VAKVLVIDDNVELLALMTGALERSGFDVVGALDGGAGLSAFAALLPDLVVTDLVMPGQEGIETIIALKRKPNPPKVLAISGGGCFGRTGMLTWAAQLGADEVLAKPFRMGVLVTAVSRLLGQAEPSALVHPLAVPGFAPPPIPFIQ
jgi:DNA-binding response OmpR family regulator